MDTRNVIAAISLSAAVIILYSLYFAPPPITKENLSEKNRDNIRANSSGSWNRARIFVKGGHVEHWINNIKVVEYDRFSQTFKNLIQKSKYAKHQGFGVGMSGRILLQDHGPGDVKFKNIKIREL